MVSNVVDCRLAFFLCFNGEIMRSPSRLIHMHALRIYSVVVVYDAVETATWKIFVSARLYKTFSEIMLGVLLEGRGGAYEKAHES